MLYQLSYKPLDCQTAEIFLSTQFIAGHGGVVLLLCYATSQLTPGHGACDHFHIAMADPKVSLCGNYL